MRAFYCVETDPVKGGVGGYRENSDIFQRPPKKTLTKEILS
ncbi:conserved hypothetical protein [delta proteobacterium NaphS2]|nr:conserved hypothetical protein [delta proteobacterium NaphS2]